MTRAAQAYPAISRMRPPLRTTRRRFLFGASAWGLAPSLPPCAAEDSADPCDWSAVQAVAHLRNGDMPCERYARALLERCAANAGLNAFITLVPENVLEAARACDKARSAGVRPGPLFGLPVPVKDSVNTAQYPTTAGTPALRHFRPAEDAPIVRTLRNAGALVLGKTNLHELSYGWTSNNLAFGPVRNPYDPGRIPGGSSGGTAAVIASRMAPLGIAEDTEGSIRVPAAFCGIHGLRPTTGRYSTQGCVPITPLFDQVGPHARSVADLALFDSVVTGDWQPLSQVPLRGVRLGLVRNYFFRNLDPELERITVNAIGRLRQAGVEFIESELPGLDALIDQITEPVQNHDVRLALARYLARYQAGVSFETLVRSASPDIRELFADAVLPDAPHRVSEEAYERAVHTGLPQLHRLYVDYFKRTGVRGILFPVTLIPAPPIGSDTDVRIAGRAVPFETAVAHNIAPGSTAGLPGLVLPAGLTASGLPVALEIDAPAGHDRALLALGSTIAAELGPLPAPPSPSSVVLRG